MSMFEEISVCYPSEQWAGKKKRLISKLYSFMPYDIERYFEPFLERGALFFGLIPNQNDY